MASKARTYDACLRSVEQDIRTMSLAELHEAMGRSLDHMVTLQAEAFPEQWTTTERRDAARKQLFGSA